MSMLSVSKSSSFAIQFPEFLFFNERLSNSSIFEIHLIFINATDSSDGNIVAY